MWEQQSLRLTDFPKRRLPGEKKNHENYNAVTKESWPASERRRLLFPPFVRTHLPDSEAEGSRRE